MISVELIQDITYKTPPSSTVDFADINYNMKGAAIVGDVKAANKQSKSSRKSLDTDTLLVILSTVLNTHHSKAQSGASTRTSAVRQSQCHSQSLHLGLTPTSSETMVTSCTAAKK